ncbi:MAG TPA: ABC transporter substrate-binding protein, partial [Eubacteriaceae bacterium]|nr:ABC transporter substrate-binding protein [Eubacteriaceae bacterium]
MKKKLLNFMRRFKMKKKLLALLLITSMIGTLVGCSNSAGSDKKSDQDTTVQSSDSTKETSSDATAEGGPLDPYKETVTIHLGAGLNPNASFPEGQTMENNAFLDAIKKDLNIEIVYDWVSSNTDFEQKMNLSIGSNTLPDIMNVGATQYRAMLKYGQIQPITDAYNNYASDMLKSFVSSGGEQLTDMITQDGQMMAVPAPNIKAGGVNVMWIRQDWLDKLGLEVPRTLEELKVVAEAFVTQDPDENGKADTIGIIGPANSGLTNIGGNLWGLDPIFGSFKSFPQYWLKDESGDIKYGSIQPETKEALSELASMYAEGLIDPQMLIRADSQEPTLAGNVGIFFGPWWAGYTMADSLLSGKIDWQAYNAPLA